jgi:hypothetical protein
VADFAVIVVLGQMVGMAENNRVGAFEGEFDILGFCRSGADGCKQYKCTGDQRKMFVHRFNSSRIKMTFSSPLLYISV